MCDSQFLNSYGLFAFLLSLTSFLHPRHFTKDSVTDPSNTQGSAWSRSLRSWALNGVRRGLDAALDSFCLLFSASVRELSLSEPWCVLRLFELVVNFEIVDEGLCDARK